MPVPPAPIANATMPRRALGKTGVNVSIVGLGGYHLGLVKEEAEAIRIVRSALDRGVSFSSTTAGTTTRARARRSWARRSAMAIATRPS